MSRFEVNTQMSTKQSLKKKVYEHKRKWLTAKTYKLKKAYQKAIWTFQEKLYNLLQPTVNEAFNILTNSNEDEFLDKLYGIGTDLEKCNHQLFELNLLHCNEFCTDSNDDETEIDVLNKCSSNFLSLDDRNCAVKPLSLHDFFLIDNNPNQQLGLTNTVGVNAKAHAIVSKSLHTSLFNAVPAQANSVGCQCNTLCALEVDSKFTQTIDNGNETVTTKCQPDNFTRNLKTIDVQTDLSLNDDSTLTLICNAECGQRRGSHKCCTISTSSCSEEALSGVTNNCDIETVEVVKDASDVSSLVDELFDPFLINSATSNSILPAKLQAEEPISQLAAFEEYAASLHEVETDSSISEATYTSDEVDLLLVHNIDKGQRTCVNISHVISPSLFSVQPKGCEEQLISLQNRIHSLYENENSNRFAFHKPPRIGALCLAIFEVDNRWYRAKIVKKLLSSEFEVMYIDYGNCNTVHLKNMRKIDDTFLANVPALSIQCSLCGVKPSCENGTSVWSDKAISWFHQQVLNKLFDVLFVTNYDRQQSSAYSVHLICPQNATNKQGIAETVSIADRMVDMGYAKFFTQIETFNEQRFEVVGSPIIGQNITKDDNKFCQADSRNGMSLNLNESSLASPDQHYFREHTSLSNPLSFEPRRDTPKCFSETSSLLMDTISMDNNDYSDVQPLNLQYLPISTEWNPMQEDFFSERNKYDINVDDACVAVEKIDPHKTEICKYFARGDCWKGKNCDRPHVSNPDVLYQVQVLSGHNLEEIELDVSENVIVKVISTPKDDDFYVHVLRRDRTVPGENMQTATAKLEQLSRDLKNYYGKVGKRLSVDSQVCIGEVYVVVHQETHCRVTILDNSRNARIQVLLVDYGGLIWISPKQLLPMNKMFMSIPIQAIRCSYNKSTSKVKPVKDCCYFANVGESLIPGDSPTLLTLLSTF